ncbi:hypothetical protein AAU61_00480 [Desulfocarbo indianensis]|nr:hypothetical protein AAU61_00480 [Desulfocarbo indianensis]
MAERTDRRARESARRVPGLKPGRYYLVHSDQLNTLEPVAEAAPQPEPLEPLGPLAGPDCALPPTPQPSYGPARKSAYRSSGFFLDRYVY